MNKATDDGMTLPATAARGAREAVVRGLVEGADVNKATDDDGPRCIAARWGHEAVVRGWWRRGRR